jgi:hypothetical protein
LTREELLAKIEDECYNPEDPATLEAFADMDLADLRNVVRVGAGRKKHCMQLESAFMMYKIARNAGLDPKNPLDPSHRLTNAELANVNARMLHRNATYRAPVRDPGVRDPSMNLVVEDGGGGFYKLGLERGGREVINLGFIPDVSTENTGSSADTTAVLIAKLDQMLRDGRLLVRERDGRYGCCTIHLNKRKSHWATDRLGKFHNMMREIRDAT